ncbi:MAG: metallophosphoesterase, partial [Desulfovibrio sp.]|nr:metallophosphoesterase [Desulfovibrio sp.]
HNAGAVLDHGGTRVAVAGLDDSVVAKSAAQTLSGLPGRTEGIFRILMDHRPTRAAANAAAGADLQLSGHTHGGQCLGMDRIVARANSGLVRGWYTISGMPLYVSSGAGLWSGFPVRLGIPAEIACITLRKGQGDRPVMRDV